MDGLFSHFFSRVVPHEGSILWKYGGKCAIGTPLERRGIGDAAGLRKYSMCVAHRQCTAKLTSPNFSSRMTLFEDACVSILK